jgi:WD40 repeat protein/serine/threonine protein kinase
MANGSGRRGLPEGGVMSELDLFIAALERDDPAERDAYLAQACDSDTDLRRRIERLLRLHQEAGSFLKPPAVAPGETVDPQTGDVLGGSEDANAQGLRGAEPPPPAEAAGTRLGPYTLLEKLGEGGMGAVWVAEQKEPIKRPVALKVIKPGMDSAQVLRRFEAERQALALMDHTHIAKVFDAGTTPEGRPYFVMELVQGVPLTTYCDQRHLTLRERLELFVPICQAIQHAHQKGIIHRDIKPSNVLVTMQDGQPVPKVIDFGLAKALHQRLTDQTMHTEIGQVLGTLEYMSPEQAEFDTLDVDTRADVYSLGVVLYELLTGTTPLDPGGLRRMTFTEVLRQIREVEPSRPSTRLTESKESLDGLAARRRTEPARLVREVRGELDWIVMKCLEKDRTRRYPTANGLARDVERYLHDEPVEACPPSAGYRLRKFARRYRAVLAVASAFAALLVLGVVVSVCLAVRATVAEGVAEQRAVAEAEARQEAETTLVDLYTTNGIQAGDQGEHARAALWFANAARRGKDDPDRRRANAIRARTWGRRAFAPLHALVTDGAWPGGLVFHPGGRHLITTNVINGKTRDANHTLWDLDAEQTLPFPGGLKVVPAAAWSPDGRTLAVGRPDGDVMVTNFPGGGEATRISFPGRIRLLTYSADGRYLAIAGGNSARVWDCRNRAFATPELVHPEAVTTLAFHPAGHYLATGCRDNLARVFSVPGKATKPLWPPVSHVQVKGVVSYPEFFAPPLFIDGGRGLITYGGKGGLIWRAVETGAEVRTLPPPEASTRIAAAKLSPDGRYLAVSFVQQPVCVRLFEVATGRPVEPLLWHTNTVFDAAFSPDSRMLLTSSSDNTARLWAVPGGEPLARPLDLHRTVHRVGFAPDGRSLVTQEIDLVRLWTLPQDGLPMLGVPLNDYSSFAALNPDSALAIPTGTTSGSLRALRSTRAYRVATGEPAGPTLRPGGLIVDASFSPDGRSAATLDARETSASEGQEVRVWDWTSGQRRWRAALPSEPRSLSYHPDGRRLAVLCAGGELLVFDSGDGRQVLRWQSHEAERADHWINNGKVRFGPDGRSLLTYGMGNDARVWEADTGKLRYPPLPHRDKCHDVQFSPDGRSMALASYDGSVRVRDLATGTVMSELPAHPDTVYSGCFSPDGRLLVTACRDHSVRVWDWRAGRLICPPFEHGKDATAAVFTPDGRWVLSASDDGTARAWDWRTGKPVTPPLTLNGQPMSLAVTLDGKHVVVGGFRTELALLDLGELARADADPDALCLWAELRAGQRFHEGGGTVNLSAGEWLDRWRAFRRHGEGGGISN